MKKVILSCLLIVLGLSTHLAKAAPAQGDGSKYAEHEAIRQQHKQYEQEQRAAGNPKKQKPASPSKPNKPQKPLKSRK